MLNEIKKAINDSKTLLHCINLVAIVALMQMVTWLIFKQFDIRFGGSFYLELLATLVLSLNLFWGSSERRKNCLLVTLFLSIESVIFLVYNFTLTLYITAILGYILYPYYIYSKALDVHLNKEVEKRKIILETR